MDSQGAGPDGEDSAADYADRFRFFLAGVAGIVAGAPAMFAVASLIVGMRDTKMALRDWWPQIATGFVAMFLFVTFAAHPLARRTEAAPARLAPFFVLVFAVGAATGSLANCLLNGATDWNDWFVKPFFWLLLLGCAPALVIGVFAALIYVWLARRGS